MMTPVFDLHCDLLSYLISDPLATAYDPKVRCSIPQLRAGGVKLQVLAVFAETDSRSVRRGREQLAELHALPHKYMDHLYLLEGEWNDEKIALLPAIENLSVLCGEEEPLEKAFQRIEWMETHLVKPLYITLTWNSENRFGGGAEATAGLKEDGKEFLCWLTGRKIAVDLSHTSDQLAADLLNLVDKENLDIPIIASHSNCRALADQPRNLPDEYIQEIIRREGIIGMNFVSKFIGSSQGKIIADHIEYITALGGERNLAFGADFFYEYDSGFQLSMEPEAVFIPGYESSACYQSILKRFEGEQAKKIGSINILNFMRRL